MSTTASITLDAAGHGSVTIDGTTQPLTGGSVTASRAEASSHVVTRAQQLGQPVPLHVSDPEGTWDLLVQPDGTISSAPAPAAPAVPAHVEEPVRVIDADPAPAIMATPAPAPAPAAPAAAADPELDEELARPATEGWRGTLNGLGLKLAPAVPEREARLAVVTERREAEQAAAVEGSRSAERRRRAAEVERAERELIQSNFMGTRTILVANPKGGSRKTTSTYALAATMGTIRGGSVIAWDANETMGTLGERARQDRHHRTVVDLLEQAAPSFDSVDGIRLGALDSYVRPQGDSHFDVLASDEDPERQDIVDGPTFGVVHEILGRFYRVVLVDTGNNIRVGHFQAALDAAHQLVIPVAASRDSAKAARKMMRAFVTDGHEELVSSAVVLLHDIERAEAATPDYLEVVQSIAEEFTPLVSEVIAVPYDNALKDGDTIEFADLSESSHTSYRRAAAAIASSLLRHT